MARIEFAPDGKRYQVVKRGKLARLWDYFISSVEIRRQIACNPYARFRLYGEERLIGTLPK